MRLASLAALVEDIVQHKLPVDSSRHIWVRLPLSIVLYDVEVMQLMDSWYLKLSAVHVSKNWGQGEML